MMTGSVAQDPDVLVQKIANLQSKGDDNYSEGLFPSQRTHRYFPYTVEDDSVFPTAVTVYTLQQVREALSERSQRIVDEIARKAVATYPRYLNNQGYPMYNFWQNFPEEHFFPNGKLLRRLRKFRPPEDIDTTSYVYLTQPHARRDVLWLKERLLLDTNLKRRRIRNTLPKYRRLRAYSTWLGEANMPIDFDVCVLSNLLLFVCRHGLPFNEHDHATLRFITSVIENDDHVSHPFDVAPWYANTTVILYHVARLAASCELPALAACRDKLVHDLHAQADRRPAFMERLLLSTSLTRLGQAPLITQYPTDLDAVVDRFYFFIASLFTSVENPITWALAKLPLFHARYRCRAHSLALLVEHEVYRRQATDEPEAAPASIRPSSPDGGRS